MKRIPNTDLWVPSADEHFSEPVKGGMPRAVDYQSNRLKAAYRYVTKFGIAIDVGAHVGLLTRKMADKFERVIAIEPCGETFQCLENNTQHLANVSRYQAAVGAEEGRIGIDDREKDNSGDRQVIPDGKNCPLITLDSFKLEEVHLVKIDVQGFEEQVLRGAEKMIKYCRPVIVMEVEPDMPKHFGLEQNGAGRFLKDMGATRVEDVGEDQIWSFPVLDNFPFDKYEKQGDYHWQKFEASQAYLTAIRTVVEYVKSQGDANVIDVGCGDGLLTAQYGAFGIDNSPAAIELCRQHGVACELCSVQEIELLGKQWDAVCLFDTLEHLYDQRGVIETVGKVTKKIHILNPEPCGSKYHTREFTADELSAWMAELGWREVFRQPISISTQNEKCLFTFTKV